MIVMRGVNYHIIPDNGPLEKFLVKYLLHFILRRSNMADNTEKDSAALEVEHSRPLQDAEHGDRMSLSRKQLNPVPSNDPADPLNWPMWMKCGVLLQVSLLAGLGGLNTAIINPAYVPLAKEFGITTVRAGYQTCVLRSM